MNELLALIDIDSEWLQTTERDEIECISIENLKSILEQFEIKLICMEKKNS